MAGLRVRLRPVIAAGLIGALTLGGGSCSCSDRVVGEAPQGDGEPACLWMILPYASLEDGSTRVIMDHQHDRSGTVCLCLTEQEYDALGDRLDRVGFPEEGTLLDEYNELAYEECKRLASLVEGVVDDECLAYYEGGEWLKDIYFARGDWANGRPPGFTCHE